METKIKTKARLKKRLGREPKEHEIGNAGSDIGIIIEILSERVEDVESRLLKLEGKLK